MSDAKAPGPAADSSVDQYGALLEVSESIASHRDLSELFRDLARRLHRLVRFDFICLTLPDPTRDSVRLHVLESSLPTQIQSGLELPMEESIRQIVWEGQQALVVPNL